MKTHSPWPAFARSVSSRADCTAPSASTQAAGHIAPGSRSSTRCASGTSRFSTLSAPASSIFPSSRFISSSTARPNRAQYAPAAPAGGLPTRSISVSRRRAASASSALFSTAR